MEQVENFQLLVIADQIVEGSKHVGSGPGNLSISILLGLATTISSSSSSPNVFACVHALTKVLAFDDGGSDNAHVSSEPLA